MAYLLTKIRAGAIAFPGLTDLLGGTSPNNFRWYEVQLKQGAQFPAVVVTLVSNPSDYAFNYRMSTSFARVQFEVWAHNPLQANSVITQLGLFLDQFSAYGIPGLAVQANYIVGDRQGIYAPTQPPQYQRILEARVFDNSNV